MTERAGAFRFPAAAYPIVDAAALGRRSVPDFAAVLLDAGAGMIQLRAKDLTTREICDLARELRRMCHEKEALFIVNDRADVARLVEADGVHLGQTDLPPTDARLLLGARALIGFSTHDVEQVRHAQALGCVDYLGFGPIFPTTSKSDAEPCPGLAGLRAARAATALPIAAIGGITGARAGDVFGAGADAVAMIGALAAAADLRQLLDAVRDSASRRSL